MCPHGRKEGGRVWKEGGRVWKEGGRVDYTFSQLLTTGNEIGQGGDAISQKCKIKYITQENS